MDFKERTRRIQADIINDRRFFHQNPEVSLHEEKTATAVAERLTELGYQVTTGVGKTGVMGDMKFSDQGPVLLIRADMDALPIQEENQTSYRSRHPGVMHACGHDAHIAIGLAAARLLADDKARLRGHLRFMFQPAEEIGQGAKMMIQDGVLTNPTPDAALGLHVLNDLPAGRIAVETGPVMASIDEWSCTFRGQGGHGGSPHLARSPIPAMIQAATLIESLPSHEVNPQESIALSIGEIHAGTGASIIPESGRITGTLRTFDASTRQKIVQTLAQICTSIGDTFQIQASFQHQEGSPPVVNDHQVTALVLQAARQVVGEKQITNHQRTMLAEDFARVLEVVPGCFFFVGTRNPEQGITAPHHSPKFDIDESALSIGAAVLTSAAAEFLS